MFPTTALCVITPTAFRLMENISCPTAVLERGEHGRVCLGILMFFILLEDLSFF